MKYLILGGTGTLGRALTHELLKRQDTDSIVCFSRDELKQKDMQAEFDDERLQFILGDIREPSSLWAAMHGIDTVFHVAALKHIDVLELNPEESIRTNIIGTCNVADGAIRAGVKHVVFSSTDKAVAPVNVYGMSKGISEKLLLNRNRIQNVTRFSVFRWANVLGSRGSVIHYFARTLKNQKKAYITNLEMTRFWIRIEDAAQFMIDQYQNARGVMVPIMKSAPVTDVVAAIAKATGVVQYDVEVTGVRPGEKLHEAILPEFTSDQGPFYSQDELVALVRPLL